MFSSTRLTARLIARQSTTASTTRQSTARQSTTASTTRRITTTSKRRPVEDDDDFIQDSASRTQELLGIINDVARSSPPPPSTSTFKYPSQSLIRPTSFHRDTRKALSHPPRTRPLPLYNKHALHCDPFRQLAIHPPHEADNASLLSGYTSALGKILPRAQSGLSLRSQRLVAKAIKTSRMMGVLPAFSNWRYPLASKANRR